MRLQNLRAVLDFIMEKVIIVGSGCAGLTAAIYAARANLSPLVLEGRSRAGSFPRRPWSKIIPVFRMESMGPQLIMNMHSRPKSSAPGFPTRRSRISIRGNKHIRIKADDEWLETQALIIASGASAE